MIQDKINHSTQDIIEKNFKVDMKGYRPIEVDQFLDEIVDDELQYIEYIKKLESEKEELLTEIMRLKQELRNVKMSIDIAKSDANQEVTNVDVLRRISNLEKIVYGKDE